MNRVIPLLAFSVLLLVPVGAQNVFADHPDLPCPPPGILNTNPAYVSTSFGTSDFCYYLPPPDNSCVPPYGFGINLLDAVVFLDLIGQPVHAQCTTLPQQTPDPTHPDQCQGASFLVNNHCFAEALSSMVGGTLLDINTISLLVGAIGTNPVITALMGITLAGIVGQTAWFVHRRRMSVK